VGTHDGNKKAGIPTTTGIPASTTADYRGNFGLEIAEATYHRWRNQYGGMKADDVKRLKELGPRTRG